jgi:phospholipid-binding lipoprotein MlaA
MNYKEEIGFGIMAAIIVSSAFWMTASMTSYAGTTTTKFKQATSQIDQKKTAVADETATDNTDVADDADMDELSAEDASFNKDPLERFNRIMFTFNDNLDFYIIKPVAELYNAVVPKPLNQGIHNFFNNLGEIPTIANDLLQLNLYQMTKDVCRLGINTTMGIGGLFDIATRMHLSYFQNDFGLTLARWGYKDSSYLVLPVLGSNTIRDGIGIPVDYFEFSVYPYVRPQSARYQVLGLFMVDHRANLLQFEPILEEAAIDRYIFMRNAYMQHRAFQIEQVKHLGYKDRNEDQNPA